MNTPICDFVKNYSKAHPTRLHMPGHKGVPLLGFEPLDITEVDGADELFAPAGIIAESEACASEIFGAHTLYSAAGSTLCIQTMLQLLASYAVSKGERPRILAARNAHRAFINTCALLDIDIDWLFPTGGTYHSCVITPDEVEAAVSACRPTAVYLTSPDYTGCITDIAGIAEVCRRNKILLAVDNAHGAYLKFLRKSLHPIDLGADICCDSAHKTLPVITGGAYLHISYNAPSLLTQRAKAAMSLFGSSSPSYLILQSLDAVNGYIDKYKTALADFIPKAKRLKLIIEEHGIETFGDEPLKITIKPKSFGYTGIEIAKLLMSNGIYPEFYDPDFVVLMLSPQNSKADLNKAGNTLCSLTQREGIKTTPPPVPKPKHILSPRDVIFRETEVIPIDECLGRVCALSVISCPPAIPLAVCGDVIDSSVIESLRYYGITKCTVCKGI